MTTHVTLCSTFLWTRPIFWWIHCSLIAEIWKNNLPVFWHIWQNKPYNYKKPIWEPGWLSLTLIIGFYWFLLILMESLFCFSLCYSWLNLIWFAVSADFYLHDYPSNFHVWLCIMLIDRLEGGLPLLMKLSLLFDWDMYTPWELRSDVGDLQ